jgi:hypothetical protein
MVLEAAGFAERLRPPAHRGLLDLLELPAGTLPVYVAHQTHVDLRRSAACKFQMAAGLRGGSVKPVALWLDMDRTGSDKASTTITWPLPEGEASIRLVPQRLRDREPRFVPVERERLAEVVRQLGECLEATLEDPGRLEAGRRRLGHLASPLLEDEPTTLARANLAVASRLLAEHLGVRLPSALISTLASERALSDALNDAVELIDDVVLVFNTAVEDLLALDVDPQVHPLAEDYLPLYYACDRCSARRRLSHERRGTDHFAAMSCSCGASRRFHLGRRRPSMGELEATDRWSTDVTLPIYLNDLASGVVVGRSSALYGLVLNEVLEKVMGRRAIPMLVPEDLLDALRGSDPGAGLVYAFLVGA